MGAEAKRIGSAHARAVNRKASSMHYAFDRHESMAPSPADDSDNGASHATEPASQIGVGAAGVAVAMAGDVPFSITGTHIAIAVAAALAIGAGGFVSPAIPIAVAALAVIITVIAGMRGIAD